MKKIINILVLAFTIITLTACDNSEEVMKFRDYTINIPNGENILVPAEGMTMEIYAINTLTNEEKEDVLILQIVDLETQKDLINYEGNEYFAYCDGVRWQYIKANKKGILKINPNNTGKKRKYEISFSGG